MNRKFQNLSVLGGLLAAVASTTAEAVVIDVGTGTTFSYVQASAADILNSGDVAYNLVLDGNCFRNNSSNGNDNVVTSYIAWHFQTGAGRTFDNNLTMTGRFDDWLSPASKVTEKVLLSTTGDYSKLADGSFTGWTPFYSGQNSTQTWNNVSLDGYYTSGSSNLFIAYVVYQNTGNAETWLSRYFQDSSFALSGTIPEPASLALLGLAGLGLMARRRR
ncbi:MAG: PEP-CTERM sorting domain-containing protein [Lentisphaeria bacterium]